MNKTAASTTLQRNRLLSFRQALYDQVLTRARAALFEALDALLLCPGLGSFAELALVPVFRRRWPSLYAALADGALDRAALERTLLAQVPARPVLVAALDSTVWPHPQARALPERQLYPLAGAGSPIVAGHDYSLLAWVAQSGSSWALPLATDRVSPAQTAAAVGAAQVRRLSQACRALPEPPLLAVAADGGYGNHHFLGAVRGQPGLIVVVRLRRDRVLYRAPGPYGGRGRPRKHGARFAFKDPESWGEPDEEIERRDERWGQVRLRRWNGLHEQRDAAGQLAVVLVETHRERERPPEPLWLAAEGETPAGVEPLWRWYEHRWPIEPSIRFRKQALGWTTPRFQDPQRCDRWTELVTVAQWELYLARELVHDRPRPWEAAQREKTPARVQAGLGALFAAIGSPTQGPQPRGKAPGWPMGRARARPERHPVVRKRRAGKRRRAPTARAA
jgi:DDE superfamily endonuclease